MKLSMAKYIRDFLKSKNMTIKELSNRIGRSNQNMSNKLKRDNFSTRELEEIAEALDCNLMISFEKKERKNSQ